jgi:hypothetical protein
MAHPAIEIRDAMVATLVNQTVAGARVLASNQQPWRTSQLPAIAVYLLEEETEVGQIAPREYDDTLTVVVEGVVMMVGDAEAAAWNLAHEIRERLADDRHLGDVYAGTHKAADTTRKRTRVFLDDSAERPVAVAELTYEVLYRGREEDDPAALSDFEQAGSTFHLHGADTWAATFAGTPTDGAYSLLFQGDALLSPVVVQVVRAAGVPATNADLGGELRLRLDEAKDDSLRGLLDAVGGAGAVAVYSLESGTPEITVTASAPAPGTLTISNTHVHASDDGQDELTLEGAVP